MKNFLVMIGIALTLILAIIGGALGYGQVLNKVENTKEDVKKIENKQEKIEEYISEQKVLQNDIDHLKEDMGDIKDFMQKLDKKL